MKTIKIGDEITYIYSGGRTKVSKVENIELDNGEYNYGDRCVDSHDLDKAVNGLLELENGESITFLQVVCINNRQKKNFKVSYVLGTEAVREYSNCVDSGEKWSVSSLCDCGSVSHGEFATQAELDAYIQGIEDATGWLESERMMTDKEWKEYLGKYFSDEDDNDD